MTKKEFAFALYQKLGLDFDESKIEKRLASLKTVKVERAVNYLDSKSWGIDDCRFVKAVLHL